MFKHILSRIVIAVTLATAIFGCGHRKVASTATPVSAPTVTPVSAPVASQSATPSQALSYRPYPSQSGSATQEPPSSPQVTSTSANASSAPGISPADIEVKGKYDSKSKIAMGTVTNTGNATPVLTRLTVNVSGQRSVYAKSNHQQLGGYQRTVVATGVDTFRNLRPGETRSFEIQCNDTPLSETYNQEVTYLDMDDDIKYNVALQE